MVTGYVDSIDTKNDFIHIYDHESRHYVAVNSLVRPQVGQFVEFTPIIPKFGKFKKAVIHRIFLITAEGAESFGYRDVEVIATHPDKGYCSWRLASWGRFPTGEMCQSRTVPNWQDISPIFEIGVEEVSYTTGYMSFSTPILGVEKIGEKSENENELKSERSDACIYSRLVKIGEKSGNGVDSVKIGEKAEIGEKIQKGTRLRIIVFLKRYKGIKQPHVVRAEVIYDICAETSAEIGEKNIDSVRTSGVRMHYLKEIGEKSDGEREKVIGKVGVCAGVCVDRKIGEKIVVGGHSEIGEKERLKRVITLLHKNGKKDHMQKRKLDSMTLIIKAIFVDSNVTLEHLCHLTGRSQSTIELHLGYLINHNLITRQGPDKGGEWQLSDGE